MMKRLAIVMALMFCYVSAHAQIATPLLDRNMKVQSSAAAGWRDGTTVGINAVKAEGKAKVDDTEVGDIDIGGSIPAVIAAWKGEELAVELYMATDTTKKIELDYTDPNPQDLSAYGLPAAVYYNQTGESEDKLPETRLNLAYVFGEALSVGLGYRVEETKNETSFSGVPLGIPAAYVAGFSYSGSTERKETETGLMVSASLKLAEMFYIAGGMENVTYKYSDDTNDLDTDWSNTIIGLGLLVGEPGESRFRVEYSMITSPEAEDSDGNALHFKTDYSTMSLEALFGNFLLSYVTSTQKEADAYSMFLQAQSDNEIVYTEMGLGWMPEEGFSVAVYSFKVEQTETAANAEFTAEPTGWRLNLGWNF